MKKVDEADHENQALRQSVEQKDREIKQLQTDMKTLRKQCDAEVSRSSCGEACQVMHMFIPAVLSRS